MRDQDFLRVQGAKSNFWGEAADAKPNVVIAVVREVLETAG
jgi:hypothetical protein